MANASDRRLDALRALADRPGTEHEGRLAREILQRLEGNTADFQEEAFRGFLRREVSLDDLLRALKTQPLTPEEKMMVDEQERARKRYELRREINRRFKKGDRVLHNGKAGVVSDLGYDGGIFVKFDDAMWPRHVFPCVDGEWSVTVEPSSCCTREPSEYPPAAE